MIMVTESRGSRTPTPPEVDCEVKLTNFILLFAAVFIALGILNGIYLTSSLQLSDVWKTTLLSIYSIPILGWFIFLVNTYPAVDFLIGFSAIGLNVVIILLAPGSPSGGARPLTIPKRRSD